MTLQIKLLGEAKKRAITSARHTPGPWRVVARQSGPDTFFEIYKGGSWIASAGGGDRAIDEADARLIAAAPELLSALKAASQALRNAATELAADLVDAAIAKVEAR